MIIKKNEFFIMLQNKFDRYEIYIFFIIKLIWKFKI